MTSAPSTHFSSSFPSSFSFPAPPTLSSPPLSQAVDDDGDSEQDTEEASTGFTALSNAAWGAHAMETPPSVVACSASEAVSSSALIRSTVQGVAHRGVGSSSLAVATPLDPAQVIPRSRPPVVDTTAATGETGHRLKQSHAVSIVPGTSPLVAQTRSDGPSAKRRKTRGAEEVSAALRYLADVQFAMSVSPLSKALSAFDEHIKDYPIQNVAKRAFVKTYMSRNASAPILFLSMDTEEKEEFIAEALRNS